MVYVVQASSITCISYMENVTEFSNMNTSMVSKYCTQSTLYFFSTNAQVCIFHQIKCVFRPSFYEICKSKSEELFIFPPHSIKEP